MTIHASWVHGYTARPEWVGDNLLQVRDGRHDGGTGNIPWSDIHGTPHGWGVTYRGKKSLFPGFGGSLTTGPLDPEAPFRFSLKGTWFHFAPPTPVLVADRRARLLRVFVLWDSAPQVSMSVVHVWDGPTRIAVLPTTYPARGRIDQLIPGVTQFDLPTPHAMSFSVGISVAVHFQEEGDITFCTAGADFDI